MRVQADTQAAQAKAQIDAQLSQAKIQADMQIEQMKAQTSAQLEAQKQQHETQMKAQELQSKEQFDRWKAELEAATKIMVARIGANPGMDLPTAEAAQAASERVAQELGVGVANALNQVAATHEAMAAKQDESLQHIKNALSTLTLPKRIIRGSDGRAVGVEVIQ